jgi:hypothetical protein
MIATGFALIEEIADTVMFEGYVLYPYRASAIKNRFRWQFGVVAPPVPGGGSDEPSHAQTECLVECGTCAAVTVKVRCLHLQRRTIEKYVASSREWRRCESVVVDGREWLAWDEGRIESIVSPALPLELLAVSPHSIPFEFASAQESEILYDAAGAPAARVLRERWPITGRVCISSHRAGGVMKVRVRIENTTSRDFAGDARDGALRHSLLGCHTLLHVQDGQFVSSIDPPPDVAALAKSCVNEYTWPVLAGPPTSRDLVLSAPIILYDYPRIAPESRDRFFDATEIDEMLALRVLTMTDDEKREAAATDPRADAIVQRVGGPHDAALHGAIRSFEEWLNPPGVSPGADVLEVDSVAVSAGSRVRLDPQNRADSMDMFLAGRVATVVAVHRDLENRTYLAVTIDGDPGADLHEAYGRYFYFFPHEVHPIDVGSDADT